VRFFKLWVGLAMGAALVLGITLGNFVIAGGGPPGSSQDPLVSESYIAQVVAERTAALELQILELEQQVSGLVSAVEMLESQMGRTNSGQSAQTQQTGQANQTASASQTGNTGNAMVAREMEVVAGSAGVNVRSGPSTNFNIVASLTNGTRVNVIDQASDWYEITLDGNRTGWVRSDFLR